MENSLRNKEVLYLYKHEDYTSQSINQKINDKYNYLINWLNERSRK